VVLSTCAPPLLDLALPTNVSPPVPVVLALGLLAFLVWAAIEISHPARSVQDTAEKIAEMANRNERMTR
jgi:hypothetical protein